MGDEFQCAEFPRPQTEDPPEVVRWVIKDPQNKSHPFVWMRDRHTGAVIYIPTYLDAMRFETRGRAVRWRDDYLSDQHVIRAVLVPGEDTVSPTYFHDVEEPDV